MALSANATGTPTTNFSIPKFNTASDAPNGKGVNEMMDALDTLIANPASVVTRPASLADHDVPVWNGTTWVRSATRQINNGGQILPVITTSAIAGGPPGAPADGDIWIASAVDGNGTRWVFQYNAGSGSANKWEFIGGPPLLLSPADFFPATSAANQAQTAAGTRITVPRTGSYFARVTTLVVSDAATNNNGVQVGLADNGAQIGNFTYIFPNEAAAWSARLGISFVTPLSAFAINDLIGLFVNVNNRVGVQFTTTQLELVPVRVS